MNNEKEAWGTKAMVLATVTTAVATAALAGYAAYESRKTVEKAMEALHQPPLYKTTGSLVSIVIPTLQEEDWIEPLLTSIRNQTYEPIEIVISDSSLPDPKRLTREIAEQYDARMVDSPNLNVSAGRNRGAEAATGEILLFCDADCIFAHDFTEKLVSLLENGAVLAHGSDCFYDNAISNTLHSPWRWLKFPSHTTGRGVAIRATDFFSIGGYDEGCDPTLGCREDLDLGRRVMEHFGRDSVRIDRGALVATSARRPASFWSGRVPWPERGYRNGVIPV
ncbi:hypothetical protein ES703_88832 [subsurface metagenome]